MRAYFLALLLMSQGITYYPPGSPNVRVGSDSEAIRYHPSVGFDWYVDSVNGLDTNDGESSTTALQTLTALQAKTITEGQRIGLAKGSHWRELLTVTEDGITIGTYGTGVRPILDASDIVAGAAWSKTAGRTNIYEATLTHEATGGGDSPIVRVWEDGVRLPRAASLDALDASAGGYYPSAETTPYTLYVHATGSGDPASNGKVYEVPVRGWGLYSWAAERISVTGIETRRNMHSNGSLVIGKFGSATDCLATEGTKHNVFFREGGRGTDVTASELYNKGGNAVMVVLYDDSQSATDGREDFIMTRVSCVTTDATPPASSECLYSHTSGFGATWDITTSALSSAHVASANLAMANTTGVVTHNSPTVSHTSANSAAIGCSGGSNFYLVNATVTDTLGNAALLFSNNATPCRISGGTFGPSGGGQNYIGYANVATTRVYIDGATFQGNANDYYMLGFNIGGNPTVLSVNNTTFTTTQAGNTYGYRLAAGYDYGPSNNNNFLGVAKVALVGAAAKDLATWQAESGQDAASVGN